MFRSKALAVDTPGRGFVDITRDVQKAIAESGASEGLCNLFIHHTSASLIICENADPSVRTDLEKAFARLAPDGDPMWDHVDEGPDDMPSHVRSVLTQTSLVVPVRGGRADLGTWQGIYLWEHRSRPHRRKVTVSVLGG